MQGMMMILEGEEEETHKMSMTNKLSYLIFDSNGSLKDKSGWFDLKTFFYD